MILHKLLTLQEAHDLIYDLEKFHVQGSKKPMPSGMKTYMLYMVIIEKENESKARIVLDNFLRDRVKNSIESKMTCEICLSSPPKTEIKQYKTLIERIFTFGTKIVVCKSCKHVWYI